MENKQKELEQRERKLNDYAHKLKDERDNFKKEQERQEERIKTQETRLKKQEENLELEKQNYKQQIYDEVMKDFNTRVQEGVQKQNEVLEQERRELLESKNRLEKEKIKQEENFQKQENENLKFTNELEAQNQKIKTELEIKAKDIANKEAELKNLYEARLDEEKRAKLLEYEQRLTSEFQKAFEARQKELDSKKEKLIQEQKNLEHRNAIFEADTCVFEERAGKFEKDKAKYERDTKERLKDELRAEIDSVNQRCENLESENAKLLEDNNNLLEFKGEYDRYINRDLVKEIELLTTQKRELEIRLQKERILTEQRVNEAQENANERQKIYDSQLENLTLFDALQKERNAIKRERDNLKESLKEQSFYEGEAQKWQQRCEALQKQFLGEQEKEKREDVIKREYAIARTLNNENKIDEQDEMRWLENIESKMKAYGVIYPRRLIYAFHTALKSATMSPLSVLSGVSGTGKSELPKLYAYFGGFNFLAEAVQPTWDSPSSMIGFYNMIEGKFDSTNILKFLVQTSQEAIFKNADSKNPHGLRESMNLILLDELNLAHIELYFAEFLSKFEMKRGSADVSVDLAIGSGLIMKIPLDSNLLWVGTMNEDETTKNLSDKVLDRAFCINFPTPKKLKSRMKLKTLNEISEFKWLPKTTWAKWQKYAQENFSKNSQNLESSLAKYKEITEKINAELAKTHRAIGHRVWQSMSAYMLNHPELIYGDMQRGLKLAFEEQIVQKIMPKLRGIETHGEERRALEEIRGIITKELPSLENDLDYAMNNPYGQFKFNSAEYLGEVESDDVDSKNTIDSKK